MTAGIFLSSVVDAIAGLTISGVTIRDRNELTGSFLPMPNVLYPNPNQDGFITNLNMQFDSMLQGTNAPMTLTYTLNYRFLGTQIGDLGSFTAAYSDVVDKVVLIINKVLATNAPYSGRVEMTLGDVSIGAKEDPIGNQYHGADISLNIKEMQN